MFNWKKNHKTAITDHKKKDNSSVAVTNGKRGKEYIIEFDPKMGLSAEEYRSAMAGLSLIAAYRKQKKEACGQTKAGGFYV